MPPPLSRRWLWALPTLAACVLFVSLGRWQWSRGEHRAEQWREFESSESAGAGTRDATARELESLPRFTRVRLRGRFDGAHQFLLDNISDGGRAGYEVLTPLLLDDGGAVLVDRGWVPGSGYREQLPEVALPSDAPPRTITGRVTPGLVLLDATDPQGYARHWRPPGLEPARHFSYAVQWWAFAALAVVLFLVLNFRRKKPT
jgi:surfeit locus 1 family protein